MRWLISSETSKSSRDVWDGWQHFLKHPVSHSTNIATARVEFESDVNLCICIGRKQAQIQRKPQACRKIAQRMRPTQQRPMHRTHISQTHLTHRRKLLARPNTDALVRRTRFAFRGRTRVALRTHSADAIETFIGLISQAH